MKSAVKHRRSDATDREHCKVEDHQYGGNTCQRSVAKAVIAREPEGTWTAESSHEGSLGRGLQVRSTRVLNTDVRPMIVEVEATSWRLREVMWVRELATTHRLERMRRLQMLEKQKAWKREAGFDRIKTIAEMREKHFLAGFDSEPLYSKLYNPGWPHSPKEHKLDMDIEIERLRLEILLSSQPASSPQCNSSPRRSPRGRYEVERTLTAAR